MRRSAMPTSPSIRTQCPMIRAPPMIASGLRIGTPASTTRGFKEAEMSQVASWIADVIDAGGAEPVVQRVRAQVIELCRRFPVYVS